MRVGLLIVLCMLAACERDDDDATPDAASGDGSTSTLDAPFSCMPVAPVAPGPACLALAPSQLRGSTPFGTLDVALDNFAAGDCITISAARVAWTGACGEQLRAQFSYPVVETGSGRRVTGSFDTDARFEFQPAGMATQEVLAAVHVDVATWQEGQGTHDIDITLTVTDAGFALPPLRIAGTFCEWPYYLC